MKAGAVLFVAVKLLRCRLAVVQVIVASCDVAPSSSVERAVDTGGVIGPVSTEILVEL